MYGVPGWVDPLGAGKYRISSGEGKRQAFKTNSGKMSSSHHLGIDMAAPKGTRVGSAMSGTVMSAGHINGYGNTVVVRAPDGTYVQYAHLDSINVAPGQQLTAGQQLGTVGSTGNSTGPHLDMIVSRNGMALKRDGTPHARTKSWLTDGGKQAASYMPAASTPAAQQSEIALALGKLQSMQQAAQQITASVEAPAPIEIPTLAKVDTFDVPEVPTATQALDMLAASNVAAPTTAVPVADTSADLTQDWSDSLSYALQANRYNADRDAAINRMFSESLSEDAPAYGTMPESVSAYLKTLIDKA